MHSNVLLIHFHFLLYTEYILLFSCNASSYVSRINHKPIKVNNHWKLQTKSNLAIIIHQIKFIFPPLEQKNNTTAINDLPAPSWTHSSNPQTPTLTQIANHLSNTNNHYTASSYPTNILNITPRSLITSCGNRKNHSTIKTLTHQSIFLETWCHPFF